VVVEGVPGCLAHLAVRTGLRWGSDFIIFSGTGVVPYHLSHSLVLFCFSYFSNTLIFIPGQPEP
jgi:hypothetical protein